MRRVRLFLLTVGVATTLVAAATPAPASHSWAGYHWARPANPISLEIVDSMVGEWDEYLPPVSADWTASSVLDTRVTPGADSLGERFLCLPIRGKIRACNAPNPNLLWLGLATVWLDSSNHIVQATTQVNDAWFDTPLFDDPNAKRHVLCQEIGHDFGLDHQYTEPTCMDDENGLFDPGFVSPGAHDYAQLDLIYQHLDGSKAAKECSKNCDSRAPAASSTRTTVRSWREGKLTVVQYVLWAS